MRKLLNYILFPFVILLFHNGCFQNSHNHVIEKSKVIQYTHYSNIDKNGYPLDSPFYYFPKGIFIDTINCFVGKLGNPVKSLFTSKEYYSHVHDVPIENLKDTFDIEIDTTYFSEESYLLYKMHEPSLSDHYLNKEIYRMIAFRSFDNPLVIRIENDNGKIKVYNKELKINIHYKKEILAVRFVPPIIDGESAQINEELSPDSIDVYNYSTFDLVIDEHTILSKVLWNNLEAIIDSSSFWRTKPELYLNHIQLDGSMWFLEGHTEKGYQVKRILK